MLDFLYIVPYIQNQALFYHLLEALFYLYQFYYCNTAHPYFCASDAGKIVSQNRARRFNESRGQRMIIRDENYFTDKYELTRTHSEVLEAVKVVKPGKTLDLGCGNGRNSLYLAANGYDVDAWDKNAMSIANVERIKSIENLDNLPWAELDEIEMRSYDIKQLIITSRGCPGKCIYCASAALSGTRYRNRSAAFRAACRRPCRAGRWARWRAWAAAAPARACRPAWLWGRATTR